ncbi:hypothetical protein HDV63DRAFT_77321 [Trichoderma sp. SZMC 28014]
MLTEWGRFGQGFFSILWTTSRDDEYARHVVVFRKWFSIFMFIFSILFFDEYIVGVHFWLCFWLLCDVTDVAAPFSTCAANVCSAGCCGYCINWVI